MLKHKVLQCCQQYPHDCSIVSYRSKPGVAARALPTSSSRTTNVPVSVAHFGISAERQQKTRASTENRGCLEVFALPTDLSRIDIGMLANKKSES